MTKTRVKVVGTYNLSNLEPDINKAIEDLEAKDYFDIYVDTKVGRKRDDMPVYFAVIQYSFIVPDDMSDEEVNQQVL